MRARGDSAASAGLDPKGSDGGISVPPERPDGDRREALGPLFQTRRGPNGASRLAPEPARRATRAFGPEARSQSRPARDGLATQRRQSKLGQVGAGGDTGPHYDSGARPRALAGLAAQSFQRFRNWCPTPIFLPVYQRVRRVSAGGRFLFAQRTPRAPRGLAGADLPACSDRLGLSRCADSLCPLWALCEPNF